MLEFKRVESAGVTISGIELIHRIQKGQVDISVLDSASLGQYWLLDDNSTHAFSSFIYSLHHKHWPRVSSCSAQVLSHDLQ
jgi:hypothetical protein